MVKWCSAYRCESTQYHTIPGITFHQFPRNKTLRNAWVMNMNMPNFKPGPSNLLCSRHFEKHFLRKSYIRNRLRKGAIPTLFDASSPSSNMCKQLKEIEKRRKKYLKSLCNVVPRILLKKVSVSDSKDGPKQTITSPGKTVSNSDGNHLNYPVDAEWISQLCNEEDKGNMVLIEDLDKLLEDRLAAIVRSKPKSLCQTCLSNNRVLLPIENMKQLLQDVQMPEITDLEGAMCWECVAILKKIVRFKKHASLAQHILSNAKQKVQPNFKTLSTLKLCKRKHIDIASEFKNKDIDLLKGIQLETDFEIKVEEKNYNAGKGTQLTIENCNDLISANIKQTEMYIDILKAMKAKLSFKKQIDIVTAVTKQTDVIELDSDDDIVDNTISYNLKSNIENRVTHQTDIVKLESDITEIKMETDNEQNTAHVVPHIERCGKSSSNKIDKSNNVMKGDSLFKQIKKDIKTVKTLGKDMSNLESVNVIVDFKMETYIDKMTAKLNNRSPHKQPDINVAQRDIDISKPAKGTISTEVLYTKSTKPNELVTGKNTDIISKAAKNNKTTEVAFTKSTKPNELVTGKNTDIISKPVKNTKSTEVAFTKSTKPNELVTGKNTYTIIELDSDDDDKMEDDNLSTKQEYTSDTPYLTKLIEEETQAIYNYGLCINDSSQKTVDNDIFITPDIETSPKFTKILLNENDMLAERRNRMNSAGYSTSTYKCGYCIIGFQNIETCVKHLDTNHVISPDRQHLCHICHRAHVTRAELQADVASHYVMYRCVLCAYQSQNREDMMAHCDTHDF